ncbi:RNA polymerase sigma-70 factor protein [Rhizobium phage RHph_Y68]|uniref:RNA polymerase sigma-70 factor protein n=1 Tax=Rhizobium phage RHph_Y68 TaxID=2509787 RepID=A0A7S5R4U9_9CAUD|nr:RNA polymerase sigma-70 factor protein [Rhizobium phage RHph_Y68]QIG67990.1 RNA polymerase sigma-70 factor protein [Rhizobium phage RHph_Y68]
MKDDFERQLLENSKHLKPFAIRLCGNETLAEDLVQTTLMRAWRAKENFEIGTNMKGWLSTILYNTHIMHWRKKSTTRESISLTIRTEDDGTEVQHDVPLRPRQDDLVLLQQCYDLTFQLKSKFGDVIRSLVFEQKSYQECAEELDVPIGTVKSLFNRGVKEFKYLFDNDVYKRREI